jgi:hypothetical protein
VAPRASSSDWPSSSADTCLSYEEVAAELGGVFADDETATYVTKVRSITPVGRDAALLHAVAGIVPAGRGEIMPDRNAIQTVGGRGGDDGWYVALFQTTPGLSITTRQVPSS